MELTAAPVAENQHGLCYWFPLRFRVIKTLFWGGKRKMNGLDDQSQFGRCHFYWQCALEAHHWLSGSHDNQGW